MSKAGVRAVRSVEIGLADPQAALRFYTDVWNLSYVGELAGVHYLRATGPCHHVLAIRRAPKPTMIRIVLQADDRATVDALHAQVRAYGLSVVETPAPLRQPHGDYGFGFQDTEGRNIAVVTGAADHADGGDRLDRPRKLSHVNINTEDCDATFACYRDALGFRLTDTTKRLRFLACDTDHHSMVLSFTGGPTLNHIAFEAPDLESVMRCAGRMREDGRAIEWGPGRHGPGNNVFCYFLGPEHVPIELTAEMQQVGPDHRPRTPEERRWPPGRLDHWGISPGPSARMDEAGWRIRYDTNGWRLDDWR